MAYFKGEARTEPAALETTKSPRCFFSTLELVVYEDCWFRRARIGNPRKASARSFLVSLDYRFGNGLRRTGIGAFSGGMSPTWTCG